MKFSYKESKKALIGFLIMNILLLYPGCEKKEERPLKVSMKNKPCYGGTLVWGAYNKLSIMHPLYTSTSLSLHALSLISNSLVRVNSSGKIEGDLALKWEVSADGLTYTFYLRRDVRFHDGVIFTSKDVAFTYAAIMDPENHAYQARSFENVKDFNCPDDYTFQIELREPFTPFLYHLTGAIMPEHLLRKQKLSKNKAAYPLIGTGPFIFSATKAANTIILKANESYHEGRPYLDEVVLKAYPSHAECYAALLRGGIDLMLFLNKSQERYLSSDPSFKVFSSPSEFYTALVLEPNAPNLTDKRVREAINLSIDRRALIEIIEEGEGIECRSFFLEDSEKLCNTSGVYNPAKAKELLKSAGWIQKDSQNILVRDGEELSLKIAYNSRITPFAKIVKVLRQQLCPVGIKLKVFPYEKELDLSGAVVEKNKINAFLRYFSAESEEICFALRFLSSTYRKQLSYWRYCNLQVDSLFNRAMTQQIDGTGKNIYRQIAEKAEEDRVLAFLYHAYSFHAISSDFRNCDDFFNLNCSDYLIKNWYKKERR